MDMEAEQSNKEEEQSNGKASSGKGNRRDTGGRGLWQDPDKKGQGEGVAEGDECEAIGRPVGEARADRVGRGGKDRGSKGGKKGKREKVDAEAGAEGYVWTAEDNDELKNGGKGEKRPWQGGKEGKGGRGGKDRGGKGSGGGKGGHGHERREQPAGAGGEAGGEGKGERRGKDRGGGRGGGKSNGDGKGKGGKSQKGGGNEYNSEAPMTLGTAMSSALPRFPAAEGGPKQCLLCRTDAPSFVSIGPCGHTDVCWICAVRLRALTQDKCCPVCKAEAPEVLITDNATSPFPSRNRLLALPSEASFGIRFANEVIQHEVMRLFEYRCRLPWAPKSVAFGTLQELENHLWSSHWRQFCPTCLNGTSSFISEQVVYTCRDSQRHCRHGDKAQTIGGRNVPGVPAHSWCEFCSEWLLDDDTLAYHMHERHHLCQICELMGQHNQFYPNFKCLSEHFANTHHVCAHPDCTHNGHHLTVFATHEEWQLHTSKEHTDRSQMTDKEKKEERRGMMLTGFRTYAEEQALAADKGKGQGKGKGKATSRASDDRSTIHFCWPTDQALGVARDDAADGQSTRPINRYPDHEVMSDHGDESNAVQESGNAEEDDNDDDDDGESGSEDECELQEKQLQDVPLQAAVASAGRQEGMVCCLDGMEAVLRILLPGRPDLPEPRLLELQSTVARLTSNDIDNLDRLRKDLATVDAACDWEPLERVLALRPLFFRLLRSSQGVTARAQTIGPKSSSADGGAQSAPEIAWQNWKRAAQATVQALGKTEQQWLRAYVHFCIEHRAAEAPRAVASAQSVVAPAGKQKLEAKPSAPAGFERSSSNDFPDFPTMSGEAPKASEGSTANWGKGMRKQAPPAIVRSKPEGPVDAWDDDEEEEEEKVEAFPALGGASSSSAPVRSGATNSSWAGHASLKVGSMAAALAPKVVAKPKPSGPPKATADFPTLGGAKVASTEASGGWAAQARERAAVAAKAEAAPKKKPEPPKDFRCEATAFPDLPLGAPKPASAAGKAGARAAKAKGVAKAKGTAKAKHGLDDAAEASGAVEAEEEELAQLVPDEHLVKIYDPLEAVALTEAAAAERLAKKGTKKSKGRSPALPSPWMASSPSVRNTWKDS